MAEKNRRGLGRALMGLFIQQDPPAEKGPPSPPSRHEVSPDLVDDLPAADPSPANPDVVVQVQEPVEPVEPAELDFPSVLRRYGVTDEDQGSIDKVLTLLRGLPGETPVEVRRQIVTASLSAFGIPVDKIVEAALLHEAALNRHVQLAEIDTRTAISRVQRTLKDLSDRIEAERQRESELLARQQGVVQACSVQRVRVNVITTFFGPAEAERVRATSARLHDVVGADLLEGSRSRP